MKSGAIIAFAVFCAAAPSAIAQDVILEEPSTAVKACFSTNAPAVEHAFASLNEGVDFLTTKLCAAELSEQIMAWSEQRARKLEEQRRDSINAMCDSRTDPTAAPDEARSTNYFGMMCDAEGDAALQLWGGTEVYMTPWLTAANMPKATSLAAKILLELRGKRPVRTP